MKRFQIALPVAIAMLMVLVSPAPARGEAVGTVSLTFDDGQASQASIDLRGMRGTFYVNSAKVGSSAYYMTWDQIRTRFAAGNEIGGHTLTHPRLSRLRDAAARDEVCGDRSAIQQQLGADAPEVVSFAYPYGDYDADVQRIVRECGYSSARGVAGIRSAETVPPADAYALRIFKAVTTSTTLADMQAAVLRAESSGGWAIFLFHGVCDDRCAGTYSVKVDTFNQFVHWLSQRTSASVKPVGEVIAAS